MAEQQPQAVGLQPVREGMDSVRPACEQAVEHHQLPEVEQLAVALQ